MANIFTLLNEEVADEVLRQIEYESRLATQESCFPQAKPASELITRTSTYGYMAAVMMAITRASSWSFDLQAFRKAMLRGAAVCICAVLWADRVMASKAAEREQAQSKASADGPCEQCGVAEAPLGWMKQVLAREAAMRPQPHHAFCGDECRVAWLKINAPEVLAPAEDQF